MTFLSRMALVIGGSVVITLLLMVVHWEPEPPAPVDTPVLAPTAAAPAAVEAEPAADIQHVRLGSVRDGEGTDWVMSHPEAVDGLTDDIRMILFDAGCVIPTSGQASNVVRAELREPGTADLAVLCVRDNRAAVYVFWGAQPSDPDVSSEDEYYPGTSIRAASAPDIGAELDDYGAIDPGMPRQIRHDGLALGHGCCATTQYWHRGRWRYYVSAD